MMVVGLYDGNIAIYNLQVMMMMTMMTMMKMMMVKVKTVMMQMMITNTKVTTINKFVVLLLHDSNTCRRTLGSQLTNRMQGMGSTRILFGRFGIFSRQMMMMMKVMIMRMRSTMMALLMLVKMTMEMSMMMSMNMHCR